jgi:hypothetical protein
MLCRQDLSRATINAQLQGVPMSLLVLVALAATASDWAASFEPTIVETYLDGDAPAVLVVGGDKLDSKVAAQALETSLRSLKRLRLVMDSAALGDPTDLSDEQLAAKAKSLPIDTIAIVRVFLSPEAPVVVVTFVNQNGQALSAFSTVRGKSPAAREGGAGRGVSERALDAVTKEQREKRGVRPPGEPLSEYDKKHIEWPDRVKNQSYAVWSTAYQGESRTRLEGESFYLAIGRKDLADSYRSRNGVKVALLTGGIVTLGLGSLVALTSMAFRPMCRVYAGVPNAPGACVESSTNLLIPGLITAGVGLVVAIVSTAVQPHPISVTEAHRLTETYNASLKKTARAERNLSVDLVATNRTIGLTIGGQF